jgi:hypothetical protein
MGKKEKKAPKTRKNRVEKPFNAGTMSNAAFFGWLRSRLRKMSQAWKPIQQVRKEAKVSYIGDNKRRKFSYVCNKCKTAVSDKECAVHHIIPAGSLKSFEDLAGFCERLFVEKEGLILLCHKCHDVEHEHLDNNNKKKMLDDFLKGLL